MLRSLFDELGGLDERFTSPEGDLVNFIDIGVFWSFRGFSWSSRWGPESIRSWRVQIGRAEPFLDAYPRFWPRNGYLGPCLHFKRRDWAAPVTCAVA